LSDLREPDLSGLSILYLSTTVTIKSDDLFGTEYIVLSPLEALPGHSLLESSLPSQQVADCWIITAENPFSQSFDPADNELRTKALREDLESHAIYFTDAEARATEGEWKEQSFVVWRKQRKNGLVIKNLLVALAGKYLQNAIFEYSSGTMTIVPALNTEVGGSRTYYTHRKNEA